MPKPHNIPPAIDEDSTAAQSSNAETARNRDIEAAWEHYVSLDSEEYERANQERIKSGKVEITQYGTSGHSVTLLASINIDPETNQVISGHDYSPEAESMRDIEDSFMDYLNKTPVERRLVVFEGDERTHEDRDEAIRNDTESGLIQYLANQAEVAAVSGEPSDLDIAESLEKEGIDREDVAVCYAVRSMAGSIRRDPESYFNLGPMIYYQASRLGLEGFSSFSDEERERIEAEGRVEEVMEGMSQQAIGLVPRINDLVRERFGRDLLVVEDSQIKLIDIEGDADVVDNELMPIWNPVLPGRLNQISKMTSAARDRYLFEQVVAAWEQGKSPFVPFGGSHVVCLKPVFAAYFA